jgi:hypothetical protein
MIGMTISLGRPLSRLTIHYEGTKITKMGQQWIFTGPSFVWGLTQSIVVHTFLQIDRMD